MFILAVRTAAGVVPCGGPKKSPRSSSIVQIIFFLSFFLDQLEYSEYSKQTPLETYSKQFYLFDIVWEFDFDLVNTCVNSRNCSTIVWLSLPVYKGH